ICRQPEYYPWRIEAAILRHHSREMVWMHGKKKITIIELGSGSSSKTRILLQEVLLKQPSLYYFPVDVSQAILRETITRLFTDFVSIYIRTKKFWKQLIMIRRV